MTKKLRIWGLVQDRLSPGFALHVHPMFRGGGILVKALIQIRQLSAKNGSPADVEQRLLCSGRCPSHIPHGCPIWEP
ncbi:hypothetical phage protein [Bordetella avium 197N]|uniref:Hypothetical phage protein n=1 Tax=Bordetella avium (strain 197N) TaxID=360910 RepID=Q2KZF9_BORA1|nr:hypothetical phage protein [Bordetella avium 197N]